MSSRPGSLARTSASPGLAPDCPVPVRDSTGKWFEPFAWFDPATPCWRTWQLCLVEGWTRYSETWPRSGMMRNGIAFRRAPLVRLTDEIGSGLLPTPEASNTKAVALRSAGRSPRNFLGPLPTPTAKANMMAPSMQKWAAHRNVWATPTSHPRTHTPRKVHHGEQLANQVGGALNPTWVEWLMGFPLGWTDLGGSGTPSSRKSRK